MTLTGALRSNPELSQRVLLGEATSGVFLLTTGQDAGPSIAWLLPAVCHQQIDMNCKGPQTRAQTNMPQNVGSKKDLIRQNIQSRHIEFCKADHTTWKLTLQDINTAPKEPKTERGCTSVLGLSVSSWYPAKLKRSTISFAEFNVSSAGTCSTGCEERRKVA